MSKADYCPNCGEKQQADAEFCHACGKRVKPDERPFYVRHKRKLVGVGVTLLVWFLLVRGVGGFFASFGEELEAQEQEDRIVMGTGEAVVALVSVDGLIVESTPGGGFGSLSENMTSARRVRKTLREIQRDDDVVGVILQINSPGGSAAASQEIYDELVRFKEASQLPVIAHFADTAASGGYYVALAADEIVANPNTITGSIGVVISTINISELAQQYGVDDVTIASGEHKDLLNPFNPLDSDEQQIVQRVVDDVYSQFVSVVQESRGIDIAQVQGLGDGRIYSAQGALDIGLVDSVGTLSAAYERMLAVTGESEAVLLEYGRATFLDTLLGSFGQRLTIQWLPGSKLPFGSVFREPGIKAWYLME